MYENKGKDLQVKKRGANLIKENENEVVAILMETERRKSPRKRVEINEGTVQVLQMMIGQKIKSSSLLSILFQNS